MIKKFMFLFFVVMSSTIAKAELDLTVEEILSRVDSNQMIEHAIIEASMVVYGRTGERTIRLKSWSLGEEKSFSEYLSPARERGKKMLKVDDQLWIYTPEPSDRIITISGHLLKQSVMGSDLSYEDLMSNDSLLEDYEAVILGEETIEGRPCLILDLTAKKSDASYARQKIWIDTERWLPVQSHLMAKNEKLLKQFLVKDVFELSDRWYPKEMHFKDMLATGDGTRYIIESIDLETEVPDSLFTKAALRQ